MTAGLRHANPRKTAVPRLRQPERTRERILEAATAEFAASGLGGARVDAIAHRAAVNKRMIYHYFGSKEDLFLAVMERTYEHIRRRESELNLAAMAPVAAMRKLVKFTFNYFSENPHFVTLLNSENLHRARHIRRSARVEAINSPVVSALSRLLARGRAEGVFRAGVDPIQLYISVAGVCYFYFSNVHTLSTIFARDLLASEALAERERHVTDVILGYLRA
ncbi:MAG: TetR family transcriptional regulator [Alphaproteobacteria bacterium]|nr:TetR family transcriptional regulator [Alphaproteobacteria bacterium]